MELIDGGQRNEDTSLSDGTAIDENTGVLTVAAGETQWKSGSYVVETYHVIEVTASVDGAEKASRKFVISASGEYVSGLDFYEEGTDTLADAYALEVGKTYDLRGSLWNQTLSDTSNYITASMDPIYVDGLTFTVTDGDSNPATGAVVENGKFTATEAGTYNVFAEGTLENWGEVSLSNYSVTVVNASTEPEGLTLTANPEDWDSQLAEGESVTLTVNGDYAADDLTWEWSDIGGAVCDLQIVENDDGSATITHAEGGVCAGNGRTLKVSLTSDPDVYLEMYVYGCEQTAPTVE